MMTIDTTYKLYTKEESIKTASIMNDSDDWSYIPVHCPNGTGYSFIEIYDEGGEFVARMA